MTETMLMPVVPTSDRTIARRPTFARRILLDSVYAFTAFLLALPSLVLVVAGVSAGVSTVIVAGLGLAILVGTAYVARGLAHVERVRLRSMVAVETRPTGASSRSSASSAQRGDGFPIARNTPSDRMTSL